MSKALKIGFAAAVVAAGLLGGAWWAANVRGPQTVAMQALENFLHDPESARLKDVHRVARTGAVCGRVNAKNRMGGYGGYLEFIVFPDSELRIEPDPERPGTTPAEIRNWGTLYDTNCFEAPT